MKYYPILAVIFVRAVPTDPGMRQGILHSHWFLWPISPCYNSCCVIVTPHSWVISPPQLALLPLYSPIIPADISLEAVLRHSQKFYNEQVYCWISVPIVPHLSVSLPKFPHFITSFFKTTPEWYSIVWQEVSYGWSLTYCSSLEHSFPS